MSYDEHSIDDLVRRANQPNLGLATTEELLEELIARTRTSLGGEGGLVYTDMPEVRQLTLRTAASKLTQVLQTLLPEDLRYRTVDS